MSTKCRQPSGRPLSPWLLQPLPKQRLSGPSRHFSKRLQAPHGLLPAHASGGENANDHLFGSSLSGHGSHEGTCGSRRQATEQIGFCVALRQGLCCLGTLRSHERPTASHGVWHGMGHSSRPTWRTECRRSYDQASNQRKGKPRP